VGNDDFFRAGTPLSPVSTPFSGPVRKNGGGVFIASF
jgi:hypothetical protein